MLLGLVFRGVAFEYRRRDPGHQKFWYAALSGGSFVAALAQGMILGALLQGVEVEGRAYAGSWSGLRLILCSRVMAQWQATQRWAQPG